MSRLGDLIRLERTRQGLTFKQVARKCGVSDKYLMEVESGKRIIADDQARRILKTIGLKDTRTEAEFTLDDIAATVDLQSAVVPSVSQAAPDKKLTKKDKKDSVISLGYADFLYNPNNFALYLWQEGGELVNSETKKATFNSKEGLKTLKFMSSLTIIISNKK